MRRLVVVILIVATAYFSGCNPWKLPGLKQEAKRQDERITKETEEAVKKSPALQELDQLCGRELPRPDGFVLLKRSGDLLKQNYLGYGYRSTLDFPSVKRFYLDYFGQQGWQVTKQEDGGWGPPEIEFRKEDYRITIYDMGSGEDVNYSLACEKLTGPFQEKV